MSLKVRTIPFQQNFNKVPELNSKVDEEHEQGSLGQRPREECGSVSGSSAEELKDGFLALTGGAITVCFDSFDLGQQSVSLCQLLVI